METRFGPETIFVLAWAMRVSLLTRRTRHRLVPGALKNTDTQLPRRSLLLLSMLLLLLLLLLLCCFGPADCARSEPRSLDLFHDASNLVGP